MACSEENRRLIDGANDSHDISAPRWRWFRLPNRWILEPLVLLYMVFDSTVENATKKYTDLAAARYLFPSNNTFNLVTEPCSGPPSKEITDINNIASTWKIYRAVGRSSIGFLTVWFLGAASDVYGRRLTLLLPPIGDILHAVLYIIIIKFKLGLPWILLTEIRSLFGHKFLFLLGCFTHIADTTEANSRTFRMTLIQLIHVSVVVLSDAVGTYLVEPDKNLWPFTVIIFTKFFALVYAYFLVPETLHAEHVDTPNTDRWRLYKIIRRSFMFLIRDNGNGRRWRFWTILLVFIFSYSFYAAILILTYVRQKPFCWSAAKYEVYNLYNIAVNMAGIMFLTKLLCRCLSIGWQGTLSAFSGMLLYLYWYFISNEVMLYFLPWFGCFSFALVPISISILSQQVRQNEQGSAVALYFMMSQVNFVVNKFVLHEAYQNTKDILSGYLPLLITASFRTIGLGLMLFYTIKNKQEERKKRVETP